MGRLAGLLDMLAAAYGAGASVSVAELEPFLGHAGSLAPWDLTDAIDAARRPPPWPSSTACWPPTAATPWWSWPTSTVITARCSVWTGPT